MRRVPRCIVIYCNDLDLGFFLLFYFLGDVETIVLYLSYFTVVKTKLINYQVFWSQKLYLLEYSDSVFGSKCNSGLISKLVVSIGFDQFEMLLTAIEQFD